MTHLGGRGEDRRVDIVTTDARGGASFVYSPKRSDWVLGPHSLLSNRYRVIMPWV
jgi:hypothetical protein